MDTINQKLNDQLPEFGGKQRAGLVCKVRRDEKTRGCWPKAPGAIVVFCFPLFRG